MSLTDVFYEAFNALQKQGVATRTLGNLELMFVSSWVLAEKGYDFDDATINLLWQSHISLFLPSGVGVSVRPRPPVTAVGSDTV